MKVSFLWLVHFISTFLYTNSDSGNLETDNNMSSTSTQVDVKVSLPKDLSGRSEDARQWILAMSTYFDMCEWQYTNKQMKLILLNKMSKEWGPDFSKGWLHKIANDGVPDEDKTKSLIIADFEKVFLPLDKTSRAWAALANLHMEGNPFKKDSMGSTLPSNSKPERAG